MKNYNKLEKKFEKIANIAHAMSILGWDSEANMPKGGQQGRSDSLAELSLMRKELIEDSEIIDLALKSRDEDLNNWQRANVESIKDEYTRTTAIPADLSLSLNRAISKCNFEWRTLRHENNFKDFAPLLEEVVSLTRKKSEILAEKFNKDQYDVLVDMFDPGLNKEKIDSYFSPLREELPSILEGALENQKKNPFITPKGTFPIEDQKALGHKVMSFLGFDFDHGRLDVSVHPFCGGVPEDVRMTTRYTTDDFTGALMGIVHETGHGCYEQGLPKDYLKQPVGHARGMSLHEGQSLFYEMQIGRSKAFWDHFAGETKSAFSKYSKDSDETWSSDNLYKLYTKVEKGFIRVDADELTYPLHVMLRYELEKDLISGKLAVKDLPEAWDMKMKEYLGLSTLGNDKDGCMQDTHWSGGAFGYFPSYTLGAMTAAQLKYSMEDSIGSVDSILAKGDFSPIKNWLKENIWQKGSLLSTDELLESATGQELNAQVYLKHLRERYTCY